MQINNISSNSNQPNFGMAKLTKKGRSLVRQTYGAIPQFIDKTFSKKNELSRMLKSGVQDGQIADFFCGGLSDYALINSKFYKSQIGTLSGKYQIKKFLKKNTDSSQGISHKLSSIGEELKNQLVAFFDKNINNECISAKQGKKILSLVEPYMEINEFAKRNAIVTDRLFSR